MREVQDFVLGYRHRLIGFCEIPLANRVNFCAMNSLGMAGKSEMDSEKLAGILGAIVAAVVLVIAIAFGPIGQFGKPPKPAQAIEQPQQPAAPAPRGPVIREVPQ
jgi:hypothetical protein